MSETRTTNLQSLVVVALRLLALDFLLRAAIQLTPHMISLAQNSARSPLSPSLPSIEYTVFPWLVLNGLVVGAILLWVCALPIARMVTSGVAQDLSFGGTSLADCYSVAFIGLGLFYISGHLAQVLNWTHYLFKAAASSPGDSWKEEVPWYNITQAYIPFIVGLVLFVKGRKWAVALARRHAESTPPDASSDQKHEGDE